MKDSKRPDDLIDDFILGLLNEEEGRAFQLSVTADPELAQQVALRREMIEGVEAFGRKKLKEDLKNIHEAVVVPDNTSAKRRSLLPYLAAAASVLVLVVALFWLMNRSEGQSTNQLYAAYFEPYDISGMQRSNNEAEIIRLGQLYKAEDYATALPIIESLLNTTEMKSSPLLLAAGISSLELDQPKKALAFFKQITANGDFNFEDEVNWYTALAYLKLEDIQSAKQSIEILAKDTTADHHDEAKQLLEKLN